MNGIDQTKQVFVDDSGRRGRLLSVLMRLGCVVVAAYLVLLVAGFLGASWVPSVRLPILGDIFDVGRGNELPRAIAEEEIGRDGDGDDDPDLDSELGVAADDGPVEPVDLDAATDDEQGPNEQAGPRGSGAGRTGQPTPGPKSSPNHGTASDNPNAGPKPKKTPRPESSPNHGSSGKSENAGPKPKATKTHGPPANSGRGVQAEPSPTSAP